MKDFRLELEYDVDGEELKIKNFNSYDNNISYIIKDEKDIIKCIRDYIETEIKLIEDKEIKEIPLFEGTLEQLNNLSILGDK